MSLTEQEEKELDEMLAKDRHLNFIDYCWRKKDSPLIVGFHTRTICERIDRAFDDFKNGKSTYLLINVHPRSGKSDLVSRYLGPHFLGEFPEEEIMQVSYQANLATNFAAFGRNIFRSARFNTLYPSIGLSKETNKKNEWVIVDKTTKQPTGGKLYASGLQSGLTGNGFALGVLDDYFAGRKEAESKVQRDSAWSAFTDDFMTRRAPACIVIVLATQWHYDDVSGRIEKEMKENSDFPQFEIMRFSAKARDYKEPEKYTGEYLFEERYSKEWYKSQYATLGRYSSAALFDCNPRPREGGILSTDGIIWHAFDDKNVPSPTTLKWARVWDLAHTAKQRSGDDPDWTSGTLMAFERRPNDPVPHLWIKHRFRTREGATKRDELIKLHAKKDGHFTRQAVESSLDSKDAFEYLRVAVPDIAWEKIPISGDKTVRATPLEPIFESPGHVHVVRGDWCDEWLDEIMNFDGTGKQHDDGVDNLSAGYILLAGAGASIPNDIKEQMRQRRNS
jgi:phage terminase large subunit-like protein